MVTAPINFLDLCILPYAAQRTPDMTETKLPDPSVDAPSDDEIEWTKATSEKGVAYEYGVKKSDLSESLKIQTLSAQAPESPGKYCYTFA